MTDAQTGSQTESILVENAPDSIPAYSYNPFTGAYEGTILAHKSPLDLEETVYHVPAYSTHIEPPTYGGGTIPVFNKITETWSIEIDHRGTIVYDEDGNSIEHKEVGELPTTLSLLKPSPPLAMIREEAINSVNNEKTRRLGLPFSYTTTTGDSTHSYQIDESSLGHIARRYAIVQSEVAEADYVEDPANYVRWITDDNEIVLYTYSEFSLLTTAITNYISTITLQARLLKNSILTLDNDALSDLDVTDDQHWVAS